MKKPVCEICGGNSFIKKANVFACQGCGTEYPPEEMRKQFVGEAENLAKAAETDISELSALAARAKQKGEWIAAQIYYSSWEKAQPDNVEAMFYNAYCHARLSLELTSKTERHSAFKTLRNCISVIDDHFSKDLEKTAKKHLIQMSDDLFALFRYDFDSKKLKNDLGMTINSDKHEMTSLFNEVEMEFCSSLENIIALYLPTETRKTRYLYELILEHYKNIIDHGNPTNINLWKEKYMNIHRQLNAADPSHTVPEADVQIGSETEEQETQGCGLTLKLIGILVGGLILITLMIILLSIFRN